jgi:hypothetical protein
VSPVSTDKAVKIDCDIAYVRAPGRRRRSKDRLFGNPVFPRPDVLGELAGWPGLRIPPYNGLTRVRRQSPNIMGDSDAAA